MFCLFKIYLLYCLVFVVAKVMLEIGRLGIFRRSLGNSFWTFNVFFVLCTLIFFFSFILLFFIITFSHFLSFFILVINIGVLIFVLSVTIANIRKLTKEVIDESADQDVVEPSSTSSSTSSIPLQSIPSSSEQETTGEEETRKEEARKEETQRETERQETELGEPEDLLHIPEAQEKLKLFQFFYKFFVIYTIAIAVSIL